MKVVKFFFGLLKPLAQVAQVCVFGQSAGGKKGCPRLAFAGGRQRRGAKDFQALTDAPKFSLQMPHKQSSESGSRVSIIGPFKKRLFNVLCLSGSLGEPFGFVRLDGPAGRPQDPTIKSLLRRNEQVTAGFLF
jgi:hypothetical protein